MKNKISAYQKLKAENLKLRQDIYTLIEFENARTPTDMMEYFSVKTQWGMRFELEKQILAFELTTNK